MDVCLVTPRYPPNIKGGGEVSVQLLAEQLDNRPEVDSILVISFDGDRPESVGDIQIKRIGDTLTTPAEVSNPIVLSKLLYRRDTLKKYDIIHAYNVYYHPAVAVTANLLSKPSVATMNSYALFAKSEYGVTADGFRAVYDRLCVPTTGRVLRHFARQFDRFIYLSMASASLYENNGFDINNSRVIPNMLDPSFEIQPTSRDDDLIRVLYVGSLIKRKGVRHLIDAATYLPLCFEFRIVGDGPERTALEQRVIDRELQERVIIAGEVPHDQIEREYAEADLFVHPGIWPEPFGRTLLEAMQAGLPVVTTDVGGPAEIVPQEELRCPPGVPEALSNAIEIAADSRERFGKENKSIVRRNYSPDNIINQVLNVYSEVL